jgi:tRNA threonylcarbamoyl adenosine modification protein (Sua5/YciO/YrdC/YwlC family)
MSDHGSHEAYPERRVTGTADGAVGASAHEFERVIRDGGVVLFPSDTVYGLACDPENPEAIARLYALKNRPDDKSAAVMFFDLHTGLRTFRGLGQKTHAALHDLLPGQVTALLPNAGHRFPLACRADPDTIGLRVISVPQLDAVRLPVLQSSANRSGNADARRLADVDAAVRSGVDLAIDGGELPGTPSTVIDLRFYEGSGAWSIVREGAVDEATITAALNHEWGFDPTTYAETVRSEIPVYEKFQELVVLAAYAEWRSGRVLELGTGTGETARRLLERLPEAEFVCVDESAEMLATAATNLPSERVELVQSRLQEPLPRGSFDLVVSALAIHHLDPHEKPDLFTRIRAALAPGGRFVLADVIVPDDPADAMIPLTPGYDKPSPLADQLQWLKAAGFRSVDVVWRHDDLVIVVAEAAG